MTAWTFTADYWDEDKRVVEVSSGCREGNRGWGSWFCEPNTLLTTGSVVVSPLVKFAFQLEISKRCWH